MFELPYQELCGWELCNHTCSDVSIQLETRMRSQKSMWKNWDIFKAMKPGKISRNMHMLKPRTCFHTHLWTYKVKSVILSPCDFSQSS